MTDQRPDPDELLERVAADEQRARRGKLKIFFGASPGVGKTYAMLEAARKVAKEGMDVVVGYVEPHVRPETQALVLGLDVLPRREVEYRGKKLHEFDLEAALVRKPQLIVVDELAHTNVSTPTGKMVLHTKRWRDVVQLLEAGIDVYTTLNVQHLESTSDVVTRISGASVRETVPDAVFENADEVEFVDLAPDDLIDRLREGKVYVPEQAARALDHFFNKGNLIALRELALRRMAERVERQMSAYRSEHAIERTWAAAERLLVCVGPGPSSANLVRAARRMAASLRAPWMAVHVETALDARLPAEDARRLRDTMHLAEQLGAETVTTSGTSVAEEIVHYARARNATKIIIGKPRQPRWKEWLRGSFVNDVARRSSDIDVYVISGDESRPEPPLSTAAIAPPQRGYLEALAAVAGCTAAAWLLHPLGTDPVNLVMVYLVGVVIVSLRWGGGPSALASVVSVAAFDFFFTQPYYTFAVHDAQHVFTFAVMLVTGLVISTLTGRLSFRATAARRREQRMTALYALARELLEATTVGGVATAARKHLHSAVEGDVFILLAKRTGDDGQPVLDSLLATGKPLSEHELVVAHWTADNDQRAGLGTETLPSSSVLFVPMTTHERTIGALGARPAAADRHLSHEQVHFLEAIAGQVALALARIESIDELERRRVAVEAERLRNSLLSAVSHDLRTPLTAIAGAASTLVDQGARLDDGTRRELAASIYTESERLNRLVANLLDMTRLEAGAMRANRQWHSASEIIGECLRRVAPQLTGRDVATRIAHDMPLVFVDELLMHEVLTNLLENAARYSPAATPIDVSASVDDGWLQLAVADRGEGVPPDQAERIFDRFHRGSDAAGRASAGLGLAIARGIVELHDGRIWVENRDGGGAVFRVAIPQGGEPPSIQEGDDSLAASGPLA